MERYAEYRDSGVEWIGEIPAGWRVERLKFVCSLITDGSHFSPENVDDGVPYITAKDIHGVGLDYSSAKKISEDSFSELENNGCRPHRGDVLLVKDGATTGRTGLMIDDERCVVLSSVALLRPRPSCDPRFLMYSLDSNIFQHQIRVSMAGSAMPRTTLEKLVEYSVVVPDLLEQRSIAAYLDEKTAEIDGLIADVERSIVLLREYRTSVISEAVTKGLDPDAPMKDSGVEWIGEIPVDWSVLRGKQLFRELDARSESGSEELLTVSHITGVTRRSEKNVNMFMAESLEGYKLCAKGDIAANTMWLWQGAIGVSPCDGVISPSYSVYRQEGHFIPGYLDMLLRIPRLVETYRAMSSGITKSRLRLYPDKFLTIRFPVPPLREQARILDEVKSRLQRTEGLLVDYSSLIDRLREYRKSLISEAVTGKFKVPGVE